jgi:hypothetical protein
MIQKLPLRLALIALVSGLGMNIAYGFSDQYEVQLDSRLPQMTGLELNARSFLVHVDRSHSIPRGYITLEGNFFLQDGALLIDGRKAETSSTGGFSRDIYVEALTQTVLFQSVSMTGMVQSTQLRLSFPESREFKIFLSGVASERKDFVSVTGGFDYVNYTELGYIPFTEENFGIRGFYTRVLNRSISVNVGAYYSIPIHSSQPGTSLSFFDLNGRFGYSPDSLSEPWKLTLFAGGNYFRTLGSAFGYDILGPQLYPYLERTFKSGNSMNAYFKFSPLMGTGSPFTLSNREIAGGVGYSYRLKSGHPMNFNLDYSQINFEYQGLSVSQSIASFSVGYGF